MSPWWNAGLVTLVIIALNIFLLYQFLYIIRLYAAAVLYPYRLRYRFIKDLFEKRAYILMDFLRLLFRRGFAGADRGLGYRGSYASLGGLVPITTDGLDGTTTEHGGG